MLPTAYCLLAEAGLLRLDPPTRARVLMALLGIILVGMFLLAFVLIGARWVRRLLRMPPRPSRVTTLPKRPLLHWRDRRAESGEVKGETLYGGEEAGETVKD
jgi:hypothetical protein